MLKALLTSCYFVALAAAGAADGPLDPSAVRALKFEPKNPAVMIRWGGQSKVAAIKDAEAARQAFGNNDAQALIGQVDFSIEQLALVSWTTSGPPEGKLLFEIRGKGSKQRLTFYVQAPANAKVRGQMARLGLDLFAVPKGWAMSFDDKERAGR